MTLPGLLAAGLPEEISATAPLAASAVAAFATLYASYDHATA